MRIIGTLCFTLSALLLAAPPADAAKKKRSAKKVAKVCAGKDLMPELRAKNPATYLSVLANTTKTPNERAILWRVEKDNTEPSYLFGTVHLSDERITTLSDVVKTALTSSKQLLVETDDPSASSAAGALTRASQTAIYQNGASLKDKLTTDEFAKVRKSLDKLGLPAATMHLFRPWLVSMLTAASPCERKRTKKGVPFLDKKLIDMAKAKSIPVAGLETLDGQLAALASVPDDDQVAMLRVDLAYQDRKDDLMETMVRFYEKRRISAAWHLQLALAEEAGVGPETYDAFKEVIVDARNRTMRDGALPYLEQGGAFIAVGALHLPGETGLVALLKDKGYNLVPLY